MRPIALWVQLQKGHLWGLKVAAAKPRPYLFASNILAVDEHLLLCPKVGLMSGPLQG